MQKTAGFTIPGGRYFRSSGCQRSLKKSATSLPQAAGRGFSPLRPRGTTVPFPVRHWGEEENQNAAAAPFPGFWEMETGRDYLNRFVEEVDWYDSIVLGNVLPAAVPWADLPRPLKSWLRNYIGGTLLYFISAFLWGFYIYYLRRGRYLPKDAIPSNKAMILQMQVAMKAMPIYCALPTFSEYMVEHGWTRCYSSVHEVGLPLYFIYLGTYLVFCEIGIYWMHRELHDIKPLYKYLHATHHIYNKQNTLSPFAGLAFHPIDGILQALPHVICLFIVPTHFMTHIILLFIEAVWTANIHDTIHGKVWPVMGAGYHTIHHTTYRHNYGHYTVWMDWMFGTLLDPEEDVKKVE